MKRSVASIFLGVIFVVIGLFFLAGSWYAYSDYTHIQKYDGRASGTVTKKHFQTTADGGGNYTLDYSFVDSKSNKISRNNRITKQQWDNLKEGDILEIRYNQSDPKLNTLMQNGSTSIVYAFFIFILGTVFLIFGIQRFFNGFRRN